MTAPDLSVIAAAVRLRDRCTTAAVAHHERAGLAPSMQYARATYDAIAELIREDERRRLAEAGRLAPIDGDSEWAIRFNSLRGQSSILTRDNEDDARSFFTEPAGTENTELVRRWVGPWQPVPTDQP